MANIKISELSQASALTGSEVLPIVQSDVTKKTSIQDVVNLAPSIPLTVESDGQYTWDWSYSGSVFTSVALNINGVGNGSFSVSGTSYISPVIPTALVKFASSYDDTVQTISSYIKIKGNMCPITYDNRRYYGSGTGHSLDVEISDATCLYYVDLNSYVSAFSAPKAKKTDYFYAYPTGGNATLDIPFDLSDLEIIMDLGLWNVSLPAPGNITQIFPSLNTLRYGEIYETTNLTEVSLPNLQFSSSYGAGLLIRDFSGEGASITKVDLSGTLVIPRYLEIRGSLITDVKISNINATTLSADNINWAFYNCAMTESDVNYFLDAVNAACGLVPPAGVNLNLELPGTVAMSAPTVARLQTLYNNATGGYKSVGYFDGSTYIYL